MNEGKQICPICGRSMKAQYSQAQGKPLSCEMCFDCGVEFSGKRFYKILVSGNLSEIRVPKTKKPLKRDEFYTARELSEILEISPNNARKKPIKYLQKGRKRLYKGGDIIKYLKEKQ